MAVRRGVGHYLFETLRRAAARAPQLKPNTRRLHLRRRGNPHFLALLGPASGAEDRARRMKLTTPHHANDTEHDEKAAANVGAENVRRYLPGCGSDLLFGRRRLFGVSLMRPA